MGERIQLLAVLQTHILLCYATLCFKIIRLSFNINTHTPVIRYMRRLSFYRAMLSMRGTSHGPVSVCSSVCPSVCHKSEFY